MPESKKTEAKKEYTSIRIDPNLWKEAKIEAIREDIDVSAFMERAVKKELDRVRTTK